MRRRHAWERINDVLRCMEADLAAGKTVTEASRGRGISLATYYAWRRDYGGMTSEQLRQFVELKKENKRLERQVADLSVDKAILLKVLSEQLVGPSERRHAVEWAQQTLGVSERRACAALALPRSSYRYQGSSRQEKGPLVAALRRLRAEHPRYGYRRIAALLRAEGWSVSDIQIYRLSRREADQPSS